MPILFCNIAWMERYNGLSLTDIPRGGGRYVIQNGMGGEILNFAPADDGKVYGHFETIKGALDREVRLERLGAPKDAEYVDGVDVVWTAPYEGTGSRHVVGWYRNARVYRRRKEEDPASLSAAHARDDVGSYRVVAGAEDAVLLPPAKRRLTYKRGVGWGGQASWWYIEDTDVKEVQRFLGRVRSLMDEYADMDGEDGASGFGARNSGSAARQAYRRYVQGYEALVHPRHNNLQRQAMEWLKSQGATVVVSDRHGVDFRFTDGSGADALAEVKPTEPGTIRFAIRTALGQLFDYRQREHHSGKLLIVVEHPVTSADDLALAFDNGVGLAWPTKHGFELRWPESR